MALVKTTTHKISGFGKLDLPAAYFMVDQVRYGKLNSALSWTMVMWRDQDTRNAYGAAKDALMTALAAAERAKAALDATNLKPDDSPEEIAAKQDARPKAELDNAQAQVDLGRANSALADLTNLGASERQAPTDKVADLLTDGHPDVAKIYGHEKTLPDWKDATDA